MENITTHDIKVISKLLKDDGTFPNNDRLPVLIYKHAVDPKEDEDPEAFETLFEKNNWSNSWRNGIFDYHHYHSTTHEVLGVYAGTAEVQLGGENGFRATLEKGDVIIIPGGVAHKNLTSGSNFACVGAYPDGRDYDMNYGKPEEREKAFQKILLIPLPATDPVFGKQGKLFEYWDITLNL
jgi:uncharacterized protein YjlB